MKKGLLLSAVAVSIMGLSSTAQVSFKKYTNNSSPFIGMVQDVPVRESGFSGLYYIPGSDMEFFTVSDRGFAVDAGKSPCGTGKEKIIPLPKYVAKIHRIKLAGDSIQVLQTMSVKRPDGKDASGLPLPKAKGNTGEVLWGSMPTDCKHIDVLGTDEWGIDPEGICIGADNSFWICEEFGTSVWHLDATGKVIKRYSPYGKADHQLPIDTTFKHRKANHGFEGIAITPSGKVYAFVQNTMPFGDKDKVESTRIMRILELDPETGKTRMFAYVNDGDTTIDGKKYKASGWSIGDAAAINDSEFLVMDHHKSQMRMIRVNIAQATPITKDIVNGKTVEEYIDAAGLASIGIKPVTRSLFLDLVANGWDPKQDKTEDMAIVNDSTVAVGIDNDYSLDSTKEGVASSSNNNCFIYVFSLQGDNKLKGYVPSKNKWSK